MSKGIWAKLYEEAAPFDMATSYTTTVYQNHDRTKYNYAIRKGKDEKVIKTGFGFVSVAAAEQDAKGYMP